MTRVQPANVGFEAESGLRAVGLTHGMGRMPQGSDSAAVGRGRLARTADRDRPEVEGASHRTGESVPHHFHRLCAVACVPRIRVHDLRHLAATHFMPYATQQAVDAITDALAAAEPSRSDA